MIEDVDKKIDEAQNAISHSKEFSIQSFKHKSLPEGLIRFFMPHISKDVLNSHSIEEPSSADIVLDEDGGEKVFCAKIYTPNLPMRDNRIFLDGKPQGNKGIIFGDTTNLEIDIAKIQKLQLEWMKKHENCEEAGVNPIAQYRVVAVVQGNASTKFERRINAVAVITVLSNLGGMYKFSKYKVGDTLLRQNLISTVKTLAYFEKFDVAHGSIKASNLLIGGDGKSLLLTDFIPQVAREEYFEDVFNGQRSPPQYCSPELRIILSQRDSNLAILKRNVDFHKNDVFCLGLVFLSMLTRLEIPEAPSENDIRGILADAQKNRNKPDEKIFEFLEMMMDFNMESRPKFNELLQKLPKLEFF
eukprot:GHVP01041816.1.p1 GENE.GHVP01041816.1~~GHVP01041816.1.p1  ORF type:complete len:358 (-),score=78.60 GHVP01041816.1:505-1578(-)